MDAKDFLEHVGILGMKWGRRKSHTSANLKTHKRNNDSEDHKKKTELKKKKVREMSNSELKALNERLQLEKQYKELTKAERTVVNKFLADIIANSAKQTASSYISKYAVKGIDGLMKKKR